MYERNFLLAAGIIFGLAGLFHLWRALNSYSMVVGNVVIPIWLSWVAAVATLCLSYWSFRQLKK